MDTLLEGLFSTLCENSILLINLGKDGNELSFKWVSTKLTRACKDFNIISYSVHNCLHLKKKKRGSKNNSVCFQ